uniref:ATPase 8 n=1 Tax=Fletcherodrilus sigillatus TaxID=169895 RepID=Q94VR3_9ANNE|nr:ATPase 8 [Fletcherodrilus sigillatus]
MPHLSPMSWMMAILSTWSIMMLFTSNIWWSNQHIFKTTSHKMHNNMKTSWQWSLQDGW